MATTDNESKDKGRDYEGKSRRIQAWSDFLKSISKVLWLVVILIILVVLGKIFLFKSPDKTRDRTKPIKKPVVTRVEWSRINQRVDMMLADGLKDEVQTLLNQGLDPALKSMQSLGYRHMIAYLSGAIEWEEAVRTLKRDHRHYAKRQMTWFSAIDSLRWLEPGAVDQAAEWISHFLEGHPG